DDDPDHTFMVAYDGKTPAVEDDYVDIQGVFSKRQSYDTKIGGSNTVPSLASELLSLLLELLSESLYSVIVNCDLGLL
ncbi:hypothetical protein WP50_25070, partial [Lactiplantibacillus plantarum]